MEDDRLAADYYIEKTFSEVNGYLSQLKRIVQRGDFKISEREDKNLPFMRKYNLALDKTRCQKMICGLEAEDFLHVVLSRMDGNEGQELFVFCKKQVLYKVMSVVPEEIWVYYKFDLIADSFTVVVSFHEAEYEPEFPFQ